MRASSNNHHRSLNKAKMSLPFTEMLPTVNLHKTSEEDTGYDSLAKQEEPRNGTSSGGLSSSSSSSNNQCDDIIALVKNIPSPMDVSTSHQTSDVVVNVAQRIVQFSKPQSVPARKPMRTRVTPLPDTTSESADSFAVSNHIVLVSSYRQQISQPMTLSTIDIPPSIFGNHLEYVHDDRFDSTTTVDDVKENVIAIELVEPQTVTRLPGGRFETILPVLDSSTWTKRLGERMRSLPMVIFLVLLSGFLASALLVMAII